MITEYTASPTSAKFHKSSAFVRGLMGPVGSGKSVACCWEIYRRIHEQEPGPDGKRRSRWAIVRSTYKELRSTTLNTWNQWFRDTGVLNKTDLVFNIETEDVSAEIIFQALDRPEDVDKLLSLELTGAFVNEARETPKAIIDMLQLRVGRYPSKREGGPSWYGLVMDTNPPDQDHWWYTTFEEQRPEGWQLFRQPSGISEHAENLANLPDGYYTTMMSAQSDEWRAIYRDGDYGFVQDGKPVYPEYRDASHAAPEPLSAVPGTIFVGIDFGLTPAAVFGQRDALGRWALIDELVTFDMGAVKFGELLGRKMRQEYAGHPFEVICDPAGNQRSQVDERTPMMILRNLGIKARPAQTNNFTLRREAFALPLGRLIDGLPGLLVCPQKCPMLRKGLMGAYAYRRVQVSGDERYHDKPDKGKYSHVCEAAQYLMLGGGEGRAVIASNRPESAGPISAVPDFNVFSIS